MKNFNINSSNQTDRENLNTSKIGNGNDNSFVAITNLCIVKTCTDTWGHEVNFTFPVPDIDDYLDSRNMSWMGPHFVIDSYGGLSSGDANPPTS